MSLSIASLSSDGLDELVPSELYVSSPDCIKILSLDGTIKRLNPGGQVALELETINQLDGANWPSLWPGSEQGRVQAAIDAGRNGKRTQFLAFCPTLKNSPRWWDVVVTPMPAVAPSSLFTLLVVSRDVTELVEAKEKLARINEQKDAFLATLSHELRNPLSALAMAATVIEKSYGAELQLVKLSEMIRRQVGQMSRLTEDLLDASRITRGQVNLDRIDFDLRNIIQDVTEQLFPLLSNKSQVLNRNIPTAPVWIKGDRMRLAQVLGNLIANASRYSPANSSIEVSIVKDSGVATLVVTDQGQGMSKETIESLFEMYS
jgi:signal transduction histidine kinase